MVAAAATALALTTTASGAGTLPVINIAMDGKTITVSGALQSGAVTIHSAVTAAGGAEPTLFRLNPGVTPDQVVAALHSKAVQDPNNFAKLGAIVFDGSADKGATDIDTTLEPGTYLAADSQSDNPAKWPTTTFTVAQAAAPAALPAAKATVHAMEYGFKSPKTLHVGDIVRFQNDGFLVHMIVGFQVKNKADAKKASALLRAGKDSKAQKLAKGFALFLGPASSGAVQQGALTAKPGVWVLACFMTTQDGREHTQLGMLKTIKVAR